MHEPSVIILVADGLTPAALDAAIDDGDVRELAAMKSAGGHAIITTTFPSVTGVAYIPMLTGLHPGEAGVPGLRWFDRSRALSLLFGHSRSYVGTQLRAINDDLSPHATTAFELAKGFALGAASVVTRGLPLDKQLDRGFWLASRVVHAHLTGSMDRWASIDEQLGDTIVARVKAERPRFVFAAFTAGDKATHAEGVNSAGVRRSLKLVDDVVARIRRDAESDGRWSDMQLFVVSDHGHSAVASHFDLAEFLRAGGIRVRAHPWTLPDNSETAVMVGGNSMAHVYLGLDEKVKQHWPALESRWGDTVNALADHPAIDLVATQASARAIYVRRDHEIASISAHGDRFSYRCERGNPLGIEPFDDASVDEVHERTFHSCYPDSVLQLARLVAAERSGDLVISATPGWDLRQKYEPIMHVSSHGALHAAHMLVPLLCNRGMTGKPRRTADVFRSITQALEE